MLDDLKKDRQAGFGAQERLRLSMYVGGMLILGLLIYAGATSGGGTSGSGADANDPTAASEIVEPPKPKPRLDAAKLERLVRESGAVPDRWAVDGLEYLRHIARDGDLGHVEARSSAADLKAGPRTGLLEVLARVTEVSREEYRPRADSTGSERLWSVVLEGADGTTFVAIKYALMSEVGEGPPLDTKPPRVKSDTIEKDQWVLVRGVYLQDRVGTLGATQLNDPTPVLLATQWRIVIPPDQRAPLVSRLDEAQWSDVKDRFNRESRNWEEEAVYETIQWARQTGHAKIKAMLDSGELPWDVWDREYFARWKKEVNFKTADEPRPLTEGARGKIYRISGIVGEVLQYGWERIPRNAWGVDEFQILTLLADHYRIVSFRSFLPYPIDTFEGVKGERKEHVNLYGVFVKNHTYDTKFRHEDGSGRVRPITMPMFVVLHVERFHDGAAAERIHATMLWVAAAMVVFGVLFYFVLIRGGRGQNKRMEEHRMDLRRRARAKGQGITASAPPPAGEDPDDPFPDAGG